MHVPQLNSRKIYKTASDEKSSIRCAALNKSSLHSFTTGHDNGIIKLWKIGSNECITSLESNLPITCIAFNKAETTALEHASNHNCVQNNLLISGNIGGGIRLYDLNESKLVRNYGAHRCEVTDLDFFNFNNGTTLLLSCSTDSNVKIWDTRSKSSVMAFKGHSNTVNCVDFSPDGNWIVSADCIGHTKLWDMKTSKCMQQFHDKQPIHDVLFHPDELVLATACGKVVRFWDLETMKHISRTSKGATPITKILFPQTVTYHHDEHDGEDEDCPQHVIAASNQSLRIWQWDPLPVYCTHNIAVHWTKMGDMKQLQGYNDLICVEMDKHRAVVWLTDLGRIVSPSPSVRSKASTCSGPIHSEQKEEYEIMETATVLHGVEESEQQEDSYEDEFEEIDEEDIPLADDDEEMAVMMTTKGNDEEEDVELKHDAEDFVATKGDDEHDEDRASLQIPSGLKNLPQELWTQSFVDAAEIVRQQRTCKRIRKPIPRKTKKSLLVPNISNTESPPKAFAPKKQLERSPLKDEGGDYTKPEAEYGSPSKTKMNLKLAQFIPRHLVDYDERELIKMKRTMMGEHIPVLKILSARLKYLRQLKSLWKKKKLSEFVEILKQIQNDEECGNHTLFVSLLDNIMHDIATKALSFRFCYFVLLSINLDKIDLNDENAVLVVLQYIHFFVHTFSSLMASTLSADMVNEKDLSMMDRREYCQNAKDVLSTDIKLFIFKVQYTEEIGANIEELCNQILSFVESLN
mmetsp:Transcript_54713/g.87442  ORF Transcript_54713/g.87442 Transcript_54713/m.87442 type:complete len:746 (+) Transcript_54713:42-2279(+)